MLIKIDKSRNNKLTRKKWLEFSLDLLIKDGNIKVRLDHLVRCMGVSKGSFYWHFNNRDDFILSLVKHWAMVSTEVVIDHMNQVSGSAEERLFELIKYIVTNDLRRYDFAIRALVLMEPQIAHIVSKTDEQLLGLTQNLFAEMGFEGTGLEMRVRILVTFLVMEQGLFINNTVENRVEMLQMQHTMLVHPMTAC